MPISLMWKLSLGEVKLLVPGHAAQLCCDPKAFVISDSIVCGSGCLQTDGREPVSISDSHLPLVLQCQGLFLHICDVM